MTRKQHHLAIDLGSSNGKIILGSYDGDRLYAKEVHRFANQPVIVRGTIHWDVLRLLQEIYRGIDAALNATGSLRSLGTDSWGVDFGILNADKELLGNPVHYRDLRTHGISEEVHQLVPPEELFRRTGIYSMEINTIYQLYALKRRKPETFRQIAHFLPITDLIHFYLTGRMATEFSIASTTQLVNPTTRNWDAELLDTLQFPRRIFPEIVPTGHRLGKLDGRDGFSDSEVINVAQHDTASAFAAIPATDGNAIAISLGSWGIIGFVTNEPMIRPEVYRLAMTNEGAYAQNFMVIKNSTGLFLLQECMRSWNSDGQLTYGRMVEWAEHAKPFQFVFDPDHERLFRFGRIEEKLKQLAGGAAAGADWNDGSPDQGQIVRSILESIALKYRHAVEQVSAVFGRNADVIHLVGGAVHNRLLCQFLAESTGKSVCAWPMEASAVGNLLLQLSALHEVDGLAQGRELIRRSFEPVIYEPKEADIWEEQYRRFVETWITNGKEDASDESV